MELNIEGNSLFTNYNSCVYLTECSRKHNGRYAALLGAGMACGCGVGCGGAEQGGCWAASTINAGGDSRPAFLRHESVPTTASLIRRALLHCSHRVLFAGARFRANDVA
jgi:hypothetical protein